MALSGRDGRAPAALTISDLQTGLYALSYRVCCAGRYLLEVRAGRDEPVGGTPLPLRVLAGSAHPPATTVHARDLEGTNAGGAAGVVAGEDAHFLLVSHDTHGNACDRGGAAYQMSALPAAAAGAFDADRHVA